MANAKLIFINSIATACRCCQSMIFLASPFGYLQGTTMKRCQQSTPPTSNNCGKTVFQITFFGTEFLPSTAVVNGYCFVFCFCFLVWILAWILVNFVHYGNALCSAPAWWLDYERMFQGLGPGTPVRIHLFVTSEILNLLAIFPSSNEIVSGWFVNVKLKTFIRARVPRILAPGSGGSN